MSDLPSTQLTTPVRPARSLRRISTQSTISDLSFPSPDFSSPPPLPTSSSSSASSSPTSTMSPTTPPTSYPGLTHELVRGKSNNSIKRKPVPMSIGDVELEMHNLPSPSIRSAHSTPIRPSQVSLPHTPVTPTSSRPPMYILAVDQPTTPSSLPPPEYPTSYASSSQHLYEVDSRNQSTHSAIEDLPRYAEEEETEPKTLARSLWKWGWLCPLLWAVGMCILWIPLRSEEEEADPEKVQKLAEMIAILRKTELKYAKRCLYAFLSFVLLLVIIVTVAVVLSKVL